MSKQGTTSVSSFYAWLLKLPTAAVLLPIQGIGIFLWWAAGSYLGADIFSSRSFFGGDGWCDPQSEGWGVHCWGDYYYPIRLLGIENPFDNSLPNPYPAASLLIFMLFEALGQLFGGGRAGLILFLLSMAGSIAVAVWVATRGHEISQRLVLTSLLTWLAPPVLIAMDRGNSAGFLVAGLMWFFVTLDSDKKIQQVCAVVLISIIKPHFAILALVFLFLRKPLITINALLAATSAHVLAFALLGPRYFPSNLLQWIQGIVEYQGYSSVSVPWPPNLSFAQSLYAFVFGLKTVGLPISEVPLSSVESAQGLVGPVVLVVTVLFLFVFRESLTSNQSAIILLVAITFGSATTFGYYAIVAVPILLSLQLQRTNQMKTVGGSNNSLRAKPYVDFCIWFASIFSLIQFPLFGFQIGDKILTSYSLVGAVWLLCFIAIAILVAGKKPQSLEGPI